MKSEAMVLCHENSGLHALGEECRRELMAQAKWFSCLYVCGHAGAAPERPGEEGAEAQGKAHNLSVCLRHNAHLWS